MWVSVWNPYFLTLSAHTQVKATRSLWETPSRAGVRPFLCPPYLRSCPSLSEQKGLEPNHASLGAGVLSVFLCLRSQWLDVAWSLRGFQ